MLAYVCIFDDCPSDRCFFEDSDALTAHLGNQHGFAPAWRSAICPLCLEETGDGMNVISLHFTRHMEEVALGAIPRTAESDAGSDESSTMASSENSRSNSFELDEESREKGMCPVEGCGRVFRDLNAHMLTHIGERPEKCPITTCVSLDPRTRLKQLASTDFLRRNTTSRVSLGSTTRTGIP